MQNKYEVMVIVRPDLTEEQNKNLFSQINEAITKNQGSVLESRVWQEKRRMIFPIKKFKEGIYYLVNFQIDSLSISKLREIYRLNENILRTMFIKS
ncbi:MAG: 30S ribosomal protein S6 [Candidatus Omnitrophota bacterium]